MNECMYEWTCYPSSGMRVCMQTCKTRVASTLREQVLQRRRQLQQRQTHHSKEDKATRERNRPRNLSKPHQLGTRQRKERETQQRLREAGRRNGKGSERGTLLHKKIVIASASLRDLSTRWISCHQHLSPLTIPKGREEGGREGGEEKR